MKKGFTNKIIGTKVYQFATGHKPLLSFRRDKAGISDQNPNVMCTSKS